MGDTLTAGNFNVLNGATLEIVGGNYNALIFDRNTAAAPALADTAAAPNAGNGLDLKRTLLWDGTEGDSSSFTSFLGSGSAAGGNGGTTSTSTDGTFRVVGGRFQASNSILNPIGTNGVIDTTGTGDAILNDVIIRSNASQSVSGSDANSWITLGSEQLYAVGDRVDVTMAGIPNAMYYIVGVDGMKVQLSTTPGGSAVIPTFAPYGTLYDINKAADGTAYPALIVGGTTTIIGHLKLKNAPGAVNQATLRVGGVAPSAGTPTVLGTASLEVVGDLSVGATNNLAIQSNASVRVGGNVDILGVGASKSFNITGTGVGIHADSNFTLNGDSGSATPQSVNIVPTVGKFHIGDGSAGVRTTGIAAQARLSSNLHAVTSVDINGSTSSLDLNGRTLSIASGAGTLIAGGKLVGSGQVTGHATFINGGTHGDADIAGVQTITGDLSYEAGATVAWTLKDNVALSTLQGGANPSFNQISVGGSLSIESGALVSLTLDATGSVVDFADSFWDSNQEWLIVSAASLGGESSAFTISQISGDSFGRNASEFGIFALGYSGANVYMTWTAIPEPSTGILLVGIGIGLGIVRVRTRRFQK